MEPGTEEQAKAMLREGRPEEAAALLGQPWEIAGQVAQGDQRGRTIGFPTANLPLAEDLVPALGVYAVRLQVEGEDLWRDGAANLGYRPTVGGTEARLEVHIFDYEGDLYGRDLTVRLVAFLRGEKKFDGLDHLKAQIAADCQEARARLSGQ